MSAQEDKGHPINVGRVWLNMCLCSLKDLGHHLKRPALLGGVAQILYTPKTISLSCLADVGQIPNIPPCGDVLKHKYLNARFNFGFVV